MLLRKYPIKLWFVIPSPLLTNVSALAYLGKHEPRKLCLFNHSVYCVSKMTLLSEHAVDFVFFSDEKMFTVASPVNLQNDRIYAHKQCEEARHRCWTPAALLAIVLIADAVLCCLKTRLHWAVRRVWKWTADATARFCWRSSYAASHASHCRWQ